MTPMRLALHRLVRVETHLDRRTIVALVVCVAYLSGWAVLQILP